MNRRNPESARPLRCAIYARVSTDKQDTENSLDRQLRACRRWAAEQGHAVLDDLIFFDEAKSGASTLARPAFQRLLGLLRSRDSRPFDAVLVDDDSRLDRSGKMAEIVDAFQSRRVRLISVDSGRDLTEEGERLLVHVKSGLNEHYLHELARRTRNGLAAKVVHGFHAGGRTFGYRFTPLWPEGLPVEKRERRDRIGTRIEVDEEQAQVVRRIFQSYAEGAGFRAIAVSLNEDGIPSSRGRPAWDPSGVRVILLNPRYTGDWSWNRLGWHKTPESLLSPAEKERVLLTGRHPRRATPRPAEDLVESKREDLRIVPQDLWEAVRARFKGRTRVTKGGAGYQRTRSPIAGLIACSCGGNIGTHTSTRKGHTYTRLLCAWNRNRGDEVCGNRTQVRIEDVAEPLLAYVREQLLDPARVERAVETVNRRIEERNRGDEQLRLAAGLRTEIGRLEEEVARLVEALAHGTAYDAIQGALEGKDRRLRAARAELEVLTRQRAPGGAIPQISAPEVRTRLQGLWEDIRKLDGDRARLALGRVFDRLTVKPLRGDWAAGWTLEMQPRPLAWMPEGAVVRLVGCGARI